jgi:hypothetical protein
MIAGLLVTSAALAANLPDDAVDDINDEFLDRYQVNYSCTKDRSSPTYELFSAGDALYLLRDSNSSLGYSIAELRDVDFGEFYHEEGLRYLTTGLESRTDFYVSKETLRQGSGELSVVLFGELFKCDATTSSYLVSDIDRMIEQKIAALSFDSQGFVSDFNRIVERTIFDWVMQEMRIPTDVRPEARAIFKFTSDFDSDGEVEFQSLLLSEDVQFNRRAFEAIGRLTSMDQLSALDEKLEPLMAKAPRDLEPSDVFPDVFEFYVEINATNEFVPVGRAWRD